MKRRSQTRRLLVAIALLALAGPSGVLAQEAETSRTGAQRRASEFRNRRVLSGHTFMPSRFVSQPFVAGWIRGLVGGGVASGLLVPVRNLSGEVVRVAKGDLTFLMLDAEYQHRFGTWGAFRIGGTAAARTGTDQVSVLAQGIEAQYGFNLGTTIKIVRSERVALSAVGDVRFNEVYAYNLFRFIKDIIDNGFDPDGDTDSSRTGPPTCTRPVSGSPTARASGSDSRRSVREVSALRF